MSASAPGSVNADNIATSASRKPGHVTVAQFLDVITHGRRDDAWLTYVPDIANTPPVHGSVAGGTGSRRQAITPRITPTTAWA